MDDQSVPQADPNWDAFVKQNSAPQEPQPVNDPGWDSFVKTHEPTPPGIITQAGNAVKSLIEFEKGPPQAPSASEPEGPISKDINAFRNTDSYQSAKQNFENLVSDAVIEPAAKSFADAKLAWTPQPGETAAEFAARKTLDVLSPVGEQYEAAIGPLNQPQPTDENGQIIPDEPFDVFQKGMNVLNAYFGALGLGVSAPVQQAVQPLIQASGVQPEVAHEMAKGLGSQVGMLPFMGEGIPKAPSTEALVRGAIIRNEQTINMLKQATEANIPKGEEAYFNEPPTTPLTPEGKPEPTPIDIHEAARNIAPETFSTYDRLQAQQEVLRGQLSDMQAERTGNLDAQIQSIQEAKKGNYGKLQSLIKKRDAILAEGDTLDMAALRQQIQQNDFQMRDLSPAVSQAYRTAQEQIPESKPAIENTNPEQETAKPEISANQTPVEQQRQNIVSNFVTKAKAAGVPDDLANAHAELEAARYQTLAEQYPKFSAEEWYNRESAELKRGKQKTIRELAQKDDNYQTEGGSIPKADDLDKKQAQIEANLADKVGNHFNDAVTEYNNIPETKNGKIINTDSARELSEDYRNDRTQSHTVHEPASWFTKKLYAEKLKEQPKGEEKPVVLFTAGGTGAGKSTAIKALDSSSLDKAQIIYDTNMNNYASSVQKIEQALDANKSVVVKYVYREPVDSLVNGALPRAERMIKRLGSGRTVPLAEHLNTHVGAYETIRKLAQKYANNERVHIEIIDNSGKEPKAIDLANLPELDHNNLHDKLQTALDRERDEGRISDATYQGFSKGSKPQNHGRYDQEPEAQHQEPGFDELEQKSRGKIRLATDEAKSTITLFKNADASTLIHEKGHEWADQLLRLADEDGAPEQMKADAATLRKYGEASEDGSIPRRGHEKIARAFERYMMQGTAPSPALANIFAKFRQWLTNIYQSIKRMNEPVSPDIQDVFDRFLSSKPERTVITPDHEPGAALARLHERDAEETPPGKAEGARDNIISEMKSVAKQHDDKEAMHAIKTAEETPGGASNSAEPQPVTANTPAPEPATVGPSGAAAEPEGNAGQSSGVAERPKPAGTETGRGSGAAEREQLAEQRTIDSPQTGFGEQKSYFIDKKGVINFDLFKTPEDIQRYLQEWADKNPDKISAARGGVVTLDQTVKLAQSMGMTTKDLLSRKVGELYDGPQQVAAAQLFIQSAQRIKAAADAAKASGDPQKIADFFADMEDHKTFSDMFLQQVGISAEASRALGSRRAIRKLSGFQEALDIGELFQRMTGESMKDVKKQAELFASLDNPAQIAKMAQKTREANWFDYAIAYRNNNLLSGPVTHLHYLDGNLINLIYKPIKTAVASAFPEGPRLGEAGAMFNSMVLGATKGWQAAKAAWSDGVDKSFQDTVENYKRPTRVIYNPVFEKFFNVSSRAIGSIHTFGYTMNYEQELARFNFRQALSEGLEEETDAFNNRVSDLQVNPLEETMQAADAASKKAMYLKNPDYNSTLGLFNTFANRSAVGRLLLPFAKMEMNVKIEGLLNNSILGLVSKDVRANLLGANGPEARAIQIAGMSMGTSLMGVAYAMGDHINGNGPSDAKARKVWLLTHTLNSIQFGGVAIPLRALGNVGQVLMAGAEIRDTIHDMSDEHAKNVAAMFMEHVSRIAFSGTFIQNMSDTVNAWTNPVEYGDRWLQNFATGLVPYSTLQGQLNRYIDPFQRDVHSQGLNNLYGITDYVKSRTPFVSQTLQPRIDVLGNPIPADHYLAAGSYDRYIADPAVQKLQAMGMGLTMPTRDILGVPLNDKQYNEYAVTAGTLLHQRLWSENGYGILQNPDFDQLPRTAQIKEISNSIKTARNAARQDMLFRYPEIMEHATAKKMADQDNSQ